MSNKVKLSGVQAGQCFTQGRGRTIKKKAHDGRIVTINKKNGRVRLSAPKGDPSVSPMESCPLKFIGVGMRHPDSVVEIGDGRPTRVIRIKIR